VYFDPVDDLAVIAVDGLDVSPLDLTSNLPAGSPAVTAGYPFGGPFTASASQVISVSQQLVGDIYGQDPSLRQVYTLAADVNHGDSGGPLLSKSGDVAGVVFATSTETDNVGYALAMDEVQPVATVAPSLSASVTTGGCISG
jgi:S1-C subfamily serine protease